MKKYFLVVLVFSILIISNKQSLSHNFESDTVFGLEEPSEFKDAANKELLKEEIKKENEILIPNPVSGYGELHIVVESVEALNHSLVSQKADRIEIWLGHIPLAKLDKKSNNVFDNGNSRVFDFPLITLKSGYYFITIRLYSNGVVSKSKKFQEQIYQIGIHEGKQTTLRRKIPVLNW